MILKIKGSGRRATFFRLGHVCLVCRMKVSDTSALISSTVINSCCDCLP